MDHIPLPESVLHPHPQVHLFSTKAIDFASEIGEDWATYPERSDWEWDDCSNLKAVVADDGRLLQLECFLQEWLFFGLLGRFFGSLYRRDDFVDGSLITTSKLIPLVQEWASREPIVWPWLILQSDRDKRLADVRLDLEDAWTWLFGLERFEAASQVSDFANLLLSIECLCKALEHATVSVEAIRRRQSLADQHTSVPWSIPSRPWPANRKVAEQMVCDGWCPFTIGRLGDLLGGTALYYLSKLQLRGRSMSHSRCSAKACVPRKLDKATYQPRHVKGSCSCALVGPDFSAMCDVLGAGGLPILRMTGESTDDATVVHTNSRHESGYTALSHVISDGWGNFKDNLLPTCQLLRIQALVDSLHPNRTEEHAAFWIDSITVPLADKSRHHHLLAMDRMPETYAEASDVLVLDAELMNIPSTLPIEELQMRIAASDWMSRLWTLQEGILTSNRGLYLQMQDKAMLYDATFTHKLTYGDPFEDFEIKLLCWTSLLQMQNIVGLADFSVPLGQRFDVLMSLFRGRTTSIQGDVPFVFCNVFGIDPAPILRLPYEYDVRQKHLATMQDKWPRSILFTSGRRLHEQGSRWFLQSFVSGGGSTGPHNALGALREEPSYAGASNDQLGLRLPQGLLVSFPGFELDSSDVTMNNSFDIHFPATDSFVNAGALFADISFGVSKYKDIAHGPGNRMGLLLRDEKLTPGKNNAAILVRILSEDDDIVYCRYEWRFGMVLHTDSAKDTLASNWAVLSTDDIRKDPKRISAHRSDKEWCVG